MVFTTANPIPDPGVLALSRFAPRSNCSQIANSYFGHSGAVVVDLDRQIRALSLHNDQAATLSVPHSIA